MLTQKPEAHEYGAPLAQPGARPLGWSPITSLLSGFLRRRRGAITLLAVLPALLLLGLSAANSSALRAPAADFSSIIASNSLLNTFCSYGGGNNFYGNGGNYDCGNNNNNNNCNYGNNYNNNCNFGGWDSWSNCGSGGNNNNNCGGGTSTGTGTISGTVVCDMNCNQSCDSNEPGLAGVTVTLTNPSTGGTVTTTTDSSGNYSFPNLKSGTYYVTVPATFNGQPVCTYDKTAVINCGQSSSNNNCNNGGNNNNNNNCNYGYNNNNCNYGYGNNNNCNYGGGSSWGCSSFALSSFCDSGYGGNNNNNNCYGGNNNNNNCYGGNNNNNNCYGGNNNNNNCNNGGNNNNNNNCNNGGWSNGGSNCNTGSCTVVKNFCYKCPKPSGTITITKSADHGCTVSSGTSVTYTYVVANTGGVTVNNIAVTDNVLGAIGTISSLAGSASQTLTKTVTLTAASTNIATATGKDTYGNTVTATSNSVTVKLSSPALKVTASASPAVVVTGQTTTISYVVTNTGDDTLNNITVTDSKWGNVGTIATLASGASQTLTLTVTPPVGATTSNITIGGTSPCSGASVTANATVTVTSSKPGLTVTPSIPHSCIPATGGSIAYTYTVKNTGNVALNGVVVTDSILGISDTIGNLAIGASVTKTDTIALTATQIATLAPAGTITTNTTATGTDSVTNLSVSTSTAGSLTVNVIHPSLKLDITTTASTIHPGDTVPFTYTVTNNGDIEIDNITVTDTNGNTLGTIAALAKGGNQAFSTNVAVPIGATSIVVSGAANGVDACGQSPASANASLTFTVQSPPAKIKGTVVCSTDNDAVVGETVQLINSSNAVVQTTTTDSNGAYEFDNATSDTYTVAAGAGDVDHTPASSAPFTFAQTGADVTVPPIGLAPTAIGYLSNETESGRVFFSTDQAFGGATPYPVATHPDNTPVILSESDLYNGSYANGYAAAYEYAGSIPSFETLGSVGGSGQPIVYVLIGQPLLPENIYTGNNFTNAVGVFGQLGFTNATNPQLTSGLYTVRFLFSMLFTGPATAHGYTISGLSFDQIYGGAAGSPSFTRLPSIWTGGGTTPANPGLTDVPANWMAETRGQYTIPHSSDADVHVYGSYSDACGDQFTFDLTPIIDVP